MSQISPPVLLRQGIAAARAGNRAQARQTLTQVIELEPNNELALLWLASVADSLQETKQILLRVLKINPANAEALKAIKIVESKLAQAAPRLHCPFCRAVLTAEEQCSTCNAILSLARPDAFWSNSTANNPQIRAAVELLRTRAQANSHDFTAQYHLGLAYLNLREWEQGLYCLQQAQQIRPDDLDLKHHVNLVIQHQAARTPPPPPPPPAPAVKKTIVLVVDDSPTICKLVTMTLTKRGYQVISAPDGLEGLAKLNDMRPDLILLDITMPRMDGYQFCRIVKGNPATQQIPIVMLSGKDGFFDKVKGRAAGALDFITKPFEPDTLWQSIQKYLSQSTKSDKLPTQREDPTRTARSTV